MSEPASQPPRPATDPLKSFRGIVAATLVLEVIVVALALLVVANLGAGVNSGQWYLVLGLVAALLVTVGLLKRPWHGWLIAAIHVVMLLAVFTLTALGVVGALFSLVWLGLYLMRRDVARKMAAGQLPSQRS